MFIIQFRKFLHRRLATGHDTEPVGCHMEIIIPCGIKRVAGSRVKVTGVLVSQHLHDVLQILLPVVTEFIPDGHHAKRRMVTVFPQNPVHFIPNKCCPIGRVANVPVTIPYRPFHMYEHAQFIGGVKCGFRRAPGVEAHAVQSVILMLLQENQPALFVHWRISSFRMDTVILVTPQKYCSSVELETIALSQEFAETETFSGSIAVGFLHRRLCSQYCLEFINIRGKFIP